MARYPMPARVVLVAALVVTWTVACGTDANPEQDTSPSDVADTRGESDGADTVTVDDIGDGHPGDTAREDAPHDTRDDDAVADADEPDTTEADTAVRDATPDTDTADADEPDTQADADTEPADTAPSDTDVGPCGPAPTTGCYDDRGCDEGFVCEPSVLGVCLPSVCSCDADLGSWICTADCATGTCVPDDYPACDRDDDCPMGEEWCEDAACVECDNSGLACRILCLEGYVLHERNGCHPCECVPANECERDDDCLGWQRCEAGLECLDWCEAGDPSCCYGNRCVDLPD